MGILLEAKSRKPGILDEQRDNGKYGFETPYQQAKWYANELPATIKPRWIIVTDFDEFRIHDLDQEYPERDYVSVKLEDLPEQYYLFDFFFDKSQSRLVKEKELSVEAGEIVGKLYDAFSKQYLSLEESPEEQRSLNMLIVRLVFLLYAEDAGLFNSHQAFYKYMENFNAGQSRQALIDLFKMLDTPEDKRDPYASEDLLSFPYVNGSLFADENVIIPQFTEELRVELLLNASRGFDWAKISPTIFGAVFESTLNPETRRAGGMHYTSIENIHKVIDPLFLDELKEELVKIEGEKVQRKRLMELREFQNKLASLNIFDPACGSGNFLTESYIQLRRLENRVLENIQGEGQTSIGFDGAADPVKVSIKQFYGIEINDFAVSVAKTALWIAESQMLTDTQDIVSRYIDYFPLTTNARIVEGNALRMDWNDVLPAAECNYIIGNPPFLGGMQMSRDQKQDIREVFPDDIGNVGELDYVTAWYVKAAEYAKETSIRCALVSTNSISQGLSVGTFWHLIKERLGFDIDFAYKTFVWDSEASDQAHVHVVIIGFSERRKTKNKVIFDEAGAVPASHINGYLMDAEDVYVFETSNPLSDVPAIRFGSMPRAKGFTLTPEDKAAFIKENPLSEKWIRPYWGAQEFLNRKERYCLWLKDANDLEIAKCPSVQARVDQVREERLASKAEGTRKFAATPKLFAQIAQPEGEGSYLLIPRVSSERRDYIPIAFVNNNVIASDLAYLMPNAGLYQLGILSSQFHNAWIRTVAGRMKSDYRYAKDLVYNTFIWPSASEAQQRKIEAAAQNILDIRNSYPDQKIGDLYKRDKMPADLLAAHKALDKAVEEAYGVGFNGDEEKIVAHLFNLYADMVKNDLEFRSIRI